MIFVSRGLWQFVLMTLKSQSSLRSEGFLSNVFKSGCELTQFVFTGQQNFSLLKCITVSMYIQFCEWFI